LNSDAVAPPPATASENVNSPEKMSKGGAGFSVRRRGRTVCRLEREKCKLKVMKNNKKFLIYVSINPWILSSFFDP